MIPTTSHLFKLIGCLATSVLLFNTSRCLADDDVLDAKLNEQIVYVPVSLLGFVKLEVTIFKPEGNGPFPLAVINHGKDIGRPDKAVRNRSVYLARYFLSRGYAVILPMLRGFAGSDGKALKKRCDAEDDGVLQAEDILEVTRYVESHPQQIGVVVDPKRVVVAGQSLGGWHTIALGTLDIPEIKGLINFVGTRHSETCTAWEQDLIEGAGNYGRKTHTPSIWFYGDNDKLTPTATWQAMFDHYKAGGAPAELVSFGTFMTNSHSLLSMVEGFSIWVPRLDAFLKKIDMPYQPVYPDFFPAPYPAPTQFASAFDIKAVPLIDDKGRQQYLAFLSKEMPRVFMIASNGSAVMTTQGYDPLGRAYEICRQHKFRCQPYAIDNDVVWPVPMLIPASTQFAKIDDASAVPYLTETGRKGYERFLTLPEPKAFVIAPDGTWSLSSKDFDVLKSALQNCSAKHVGCKAYAVNDQIVW